MISPLPYFAMKWKEEFNCWDFVRLIYRKEFLIDLPPYHVAAFAAVRQACRAIEKEEVAPVWQPIENPVENCVIVMGKPGLRHHVGFMLDPKTVLHLPTNCHSIAQPIRALKNNLSTISFFSHAQLR